MLPANTSNGVEQQQQLSLPSLLQLRCDGRCNGQKFSYTLARKRHAVERQRSPVLHNPSNNIVLSLDTTADENGRYLLTGDKQGDICIYDTATPWGATGSNIGKDGRHHPPQYHHPENSDDAAALETWRTTHRPIQKASVPSNSRFMLSSRWYPQDSGMFFTASRSGAFHVWDANEMLPVVETRPFQYETTTATNVSTGSTRRIYSLPLSWSRTNSGNRSRGRSDNNNIAYSNSSTDNSMLSCMELSPPSLSSSCMIAVGSPTSPLVKLLDIRSPAASSHSLTGHDKGGVSSLAWSPVCPYVLASGGAADSRILLWDIRKAGSLARITALDANRQHYADTSSGDNDPLVSRPYLPDCAHLRPVITKRKTSRAAKKSQKRSSAANNNDASTSSSKSRRISTDSKKKIQSLRLSPNLQYSSSAKGAATTTATTPLPLAHTGGCVGLTFSPCGHFLTSAGGNGDLSVWDLRLPSGACKVPRRFVGGGTSPSSRGAAGGKPVDPSYMGRVPLVPTLQGTGDTWIWTRGGARGGSGSGPSTCLCAYSLQNGGAPQAVLPGHMGTVTAITHIPSTGQLISASTDGLLLLWGPPATPTASSLSARGRATATRNRQAGRALVDEDDW